jgi:dTDP-4-amino-4,6-dideoxygalactose transaminase
LRVLEDCARSCGATYQNKRIGSFDIGTFSFGYGKSFYDFGGAMVTSDDEIFIKRLRQLKRDFKKITVKNLYLQTLKGIILKYVNIPYLYRFSLYPRVYKFYIQDNEKYASSYRVKMPPYDTVPDNFMVDLNNVQARFGLKQLERIDITNKKRAENAMVLTEELSGIPGLELPIFPADRKHSAVHYAIRTQRDKELQNFLIINKIDSQNETAIDTTLLDRFKAYVNGDFPNARKLHDKIIFLPNHPNLNKKDMLYIAKKIKEFFRKEY